MLSKDELAKLIIIYLTKKSSKLERFNSQTCLKNYLNDISYSEVQDIANELNIKF